MINPLVTIIIPVYNGSNYLDQSIESALNQTYKNIEVIVINDGSNDNDKTEKIALNYLPRIKYISKPNGGVSSALNYGIKAMRGNYFCWLSHDDLFAADHIESLITLLELGDSNPKRIMMSDTIFINSSGEYIGRPIKIRKKKVYEPNDIFRRLTHGFSINGCSLLLHKNSIIHAGYFDEQLKYIQDLKMWLLLSLDNHILIASNKPTVKMRMHSEQQTHKLKKLLQSETQKVILDYLQLLKSEKTNKKFLYLFDWAIESGNKNLLSPIIMKIK